MSRTPRRLLLPVVALSIVVSGLSANAVGPLDADAVAPVTSPLAHSAERGFLGADHQHQDLDARPGRLAPTAEQLARVGELAATARWNEFGTPKVLIRYDGALSGAREGAAVDVARSWVRDNAALFRLDAARVDALEVVSDSPFYDSPDLRRIRAGQAPLNTDVAHAVLFRQAFGDLKAVQDGLLTVGVDRDGRIVWVSSTVTGDRELSGVQKLDAIGAYVAAAADVDRTVTPAMLATTGRNAAGFTTMSLRGVSDQQYARLGALPTPTDGVRVVWETTLVEASPLKGEPTAFISLVDAETGKVHFRGDAVDYASDNPAWKVFPANPQLVEPGGAPAADTRKRWCWEAGEGCDRVIGPNGDEDPARMQPYDADGNTGAPTFTSIGNNADTAPSCFSFLTPDQCNPQRPVSPTREYDFPFTNQWYANSCSPTNFTSPQRNDIDAATINLFTMHNRMHDWAYYLGFTEPNFNLQMNNFGRGGRPGDPENGQTQSGAIGGGPTFQGRDNANQVSLQDGVRGVTNQYLWQPLQAGFYAPCVDGAYDMSVVAHEYTHATSNRMTAGPDTNLSGHQAGAMGESWSDLSAVEYQNEYGFVPVGGEDPFAVGGFVTGEKEKGIRNYNMARSPLNYSDLEYDGNGQTSPHADGEIWSAVNYSLRERLIADYASRFPATDKVKQEACAEGTVAANLCPGNRRWAQIMYDAFLLQPSRTTMIDSRDAQLAADKMRFQSANQKSLWDVYASRGLGVSATSNGEDGENQDGDGDDVNDRQAVAGWTSPLRTDAAKIRFAPAAVGSGGTPKNLKVYVGVYEARITPVSAAPEGAGPVVQFQPGAYQFIAQAPGYGAVRFSETFAAGETRTVSVPMRRNVASKTNGAKATTVGAAGSAELNTEFLIDDTEATNFAAIGDGPAIGRRITVDLEGGRHTVRQVQVSAALRPALCDSATGDNPDEVAACEDAREAPYDTGGQNRFSALRQFRIHVCDATAGKTCATDAEYRPIFTSAPDAFPADRPRPTAPDNTLRPFDVPDTAATHVQIEVLHNHCTGGPLYQREANPNNDPSSDPDCDTGRTVAAATGGATSLTQVNNVRISELQVFTTEGASSLVERVTIGANARQITAGNTPVISGIATDAAGTAIPGGTATLFAKRYNTTSYARVATATVGSDGRYSFSVKPLTQTSYVVRVENVASPALLIRVYARVQPTSPAAGATVDNPVVLRGQLTPAYANAPIGLAEKLPDGRYIYLTQARTTSTGAFTLSIRLAPGRHVLVPYTSARQGTDKGSKSLTVTVR